MKTKLTLLLAVLLPLAAHAADDLTSALQKGLFEEEANQNLPAAIKAYESLLAASDEQRKLAATALFRLGECYRKLGKTNDAVAQYQRILRDYADQSTLATLSRQNLTGLGAIQPAGVSSMGGLSDSAVDPAIRSNVQKVLSPEAEELMKTERLLVQLKGWDLSQLRRLIPSLVPDAEMERLEREIAASHEKAQRVENEGGTPESKAERRDMFMRRMRDGEALLEHRAASIVEGLTQRAALLRERVKALQPFGSGADRTTTGLGRAVPPSEEEQEIRRIQALIKDSPDLINAVNVEVTKVRSGELMVPKNGTLLHKAASQGQLAVAKFLLDHGADVGVRDEMGRTPLHRAAGGGHKAMVELLLVNKADANARISEYPDNGSSPLHLAADKGYRTVCEALLAHGADPNHGDASGTSPIYSAVWANDEATLRLLLAKGAKANPEPGKKGYTPLHNAKTTNIARILIEAGAVVDALNGDNQSALHLKASEGNREVVEVLLAAGANPNFKDKDGKTPLHLAAAKWKASVVAPLIAKGANPNERNSYGGVPLDELIQFSRINSQEGNRAPQLETLQAFLAGGADPNLIIAGGTPHLFRAVSEGLEEQAEALLKAGADPNARSDYDREGTSNLKGQTPLIRALRGTLRLSPGTGYDRTRSMAMVNLLLEHKADVNLADGNGDEPIFFAMDAGSKGFAEKAPFVEALLKRGANIEARNSAGLTPLGVAVSYFGNLGSEMVEFLINYKADPNAKTRSSTPLINVAASYGSMELVEILLAAGADANALDGQGLSALDYVKGTSSSPSSEFRSIPPRGGVLPSFPSPPSSQPKDTAQFDLADRLRKAGARDWAPRPGLITVTRRSTGASQVIFSKGTNDWNRHSLIELLAFTHFGSDTPFPFPDFSRLLITRLDRATGTVREFPVDLAAALTKDGCKADQWLEWGDLVDIPEGIHKLDERWRKLNAPEAQMFTNCVVRTVTLKVNGISKELVLNKGSWRNEPAGGGAIQYVPEKTFRVAECVRRSGLLLSSSDLTRVKVTRSGATNGRQEWTFDLSRQIPDAENLWLRDGDQIEVPEKP